MSKSILAWTIGGVVVNAAWLCVLEKFGWYLAPDFIIRQRMERTRELNHLPKLTDPEEIAEELQMTRHYMKRCRVYSNKSVSVLLALSGVAGFCFGMNEHLTRKK